MKRTAILLLLGALAACTKPEAAAPPPAPPVKRATPLPSADAAKTLLANSPDFGDYQFTNAAYTLSLSKAALNAPALEAATQLANAKWIRFHGDAIELTDKAKNDKRFLVRPNGTLDIVPLAKKELLRVTNVRALPDGNAAIDFDWRWIPNDVAEAFTKGALHDRFAGEQHATATLLPDDAVLRIEPR